MSIQAFLTYFLTLVLIVVVPGPTVALVVGNTLKHGRRAGLLTVAGTQLGLAVIILVVALGLAPVVASAGAWFDLLRTIGAAYLVWLGIRLIRSPPVVEQADHAPAIRGGFVLQGLLFALANPKTLLFLGAFMPQFIAPGADYVSQIAVLGIAAMAVGGISDASYVFATLRAGSLLSRRLVSTASKAAGGVLVASGVYLAFARR